ncbi:MAG: hypothetical protein H7A02_01160 [Pseudomonadales bacterium]|nr:hypothetical protein [Pseudomonadales bacterium]MCP5170864.1 hypothetical protein [Pseudomonadales bacterium]MCP5301896.1 hypothetical protein [Pseudomonadales bacterium]
MNYPIKPKSTSTMVQGQFWSVPIGDGRFSCGVVLALVEKSGKKDPRIFLAGLLDWVGPLPPSAEELDKCSVLEKGFAHIKTITETGGALLGKLEINLGSPEVVSETDSINTWGYNSIVKKAAKHNVGS